MASGKRIFEKIRELRKRVDKALTKENMKEHEEEALLKQVMDADLKVSEQIIEHDELSRIRGGTHSQRERRNLLAKELVDVEKLKEDLDFLRNAVNTILKRREARVEEERKEVDSDLLSINEMLDKNIREMLKGK
jgi:hypothetical protein